ncbi:hypothetical protein M3Y96_00056700 [Aphelenchoides besseyi]|nr:hypothetical protein M3Y96_00056700 [Aphelenchoides besseyi]
MSSAGSSNKLKAALTRPNPQATRPVDDQYVQIPINNNFQSQPPPVIAPAPTSTVQQAVMRPPTNPNGLGCGSNNQGTQPSRPSSDDKSDSDKTNREQTPVINQRTSKEATYENLEPPPNGLVLHNPPVVKKNSKRGVKRNDKSSKKKKGSKKRANK